MEALVCPDGAGGGLQGEGGSNKLAALSDRVEAFPDHGDHWG
eukprot:CAMPEP_0116892854 /NCGR_PEP_ID=MMETSP0467-20121206/2986_1 /TAXON_ID=283647 /ORGANISM="Mesodinium pulex, Strain SPMC105" /LENGTH=41 /DNA_ID= /DNA_START= /DNA_END= /DNA_ORIENTATION=